ncbi:UvrABC system protein C [Dissostichus eleginoides]|uniref:UvrABC system protein C n=1 Tax=Dissostichus eleginoides TaxID=100907 RepID=A0AAD9CFR1_DISEL|nr:UvrABC system protein C [Dissostichus eleginoides]
MYAISGFVQSVISWFIQNTLCTVGKPPVMDFTSAFLQQSVKLQDGKYIISKQDRLLPTSFPSRICSCEVFDVAVSVGRPIILVCINGRYDLNVPEKMGSRIQ